MALRGRIIRYSHSYQRSNLSNILPSFTDKAGHRIRGCAFTVFDCAFVPKK